MKKILLFLLMILFSLPVYAEEYDNCYDDYAIDITTSDNIMKYTSTSNSWSIVSSSNKAYYDTIKYLFPVEEGQTYYIKSFTDNVFSESATQTNAYIYFYDIDKKYLGFNQTFSYYSNGYQLYFTAPSYSEDYAYIHLVPTQAIVAKLSSKIAFANFDLSTCPNTEEPEPEIPVTDSTLDDFYNIFNSKLKLLASYTLENKYLFSVIGIVVLFAVLGIFFKIFRIGGGR